MARTSLLDLPCEQLIQVLTFVPIRQLLRTACCCQAGASMAAEPVLWEAVVRGQWGIRTLSCLVSWMRSSWRHAAQSLIKVRQSLDSLPDELVLLPPALQLMQEALTQIESHPARRFLHGLASGFIPTPDGCFTFHAPSATPIHYRHCSMNTAGADCQCAQSSTGCWHWSADRIIWFPSSSIEISAGRFVGAGWRLVDANKTVVDFLYKWPLQPLFVNCDVHPVPALQLCPSGRATFGPWATDRASHWPRLQREFVELITESLVHCCPESQSYTVHCYLDTPIMLSCHKDGWRVAETVGPLNTEVGAFIQQLDQLQWSDPSHDVSMPVHALLSVANEQFLSSLPAPDPGN